MRIRGRLDSGFGGIQLAGGLLVLLGLLVYLPIRGDYSLLTGVGIIAGVLFLTVLNLRPKVFHGGEWLISLAAGTIAGTAAPARVHSIAFYEATAQILPILFLALALQARAFSPEHHRSEPERRLALIVACALLIAGVEVLTALAEGRPQAADFEFVAAALAAATTAIAIPAIVGSTPTADSSTTPGRGPEQSRAEGGESRERST